MDMKKKYTSAGIKFDERFVWYKAIYTESTASGILFSNIRSLHAEAFLVSMVPLVKKRRSLLGFLYNV